MSAIAIASFQFTHLYTRNYQVKLTYTFALMFIFNDLKEEEEKEEEEEEENVISGILCD